MSAIKTKHIRSLSANQFLNLFSNVSYRNWKQSDTVSLNEIRVYGSRKYINLHTNGITGTNAPTHVNGTVSDGVINWTYVENYQDNVYFGKNIYLAMGKITDWTSEPTPDAILNNDFDEEKVYNNIVGMKKILFSDARLAIRKNIWTSGITYTGYSPTNEPEDYVTPYYIINSENNVYKCIFNNSIASTSEPIGVNTTDYTYTADGYIWKYLGTIGALDALKFTTNNYVGIEYKKIDDASNQWDVQQNSFQGSISRISITNQGAGYIDGATVLISGDGINATATAVVTTGSISNVILTNPGENYTNLTTATIVPAIGNIPTTEAVLEIIMAPKNGHGYNLPLELNAKDVIIVATIEGSLGGYFPATAPDNEYRQITLIIDPIDKTTDELANQNLYIGPMHPDYGTNTYNEIIEYSGTFVHIDNHEKVSKDSSSKEEIRVILNF